MRRLLIKELRLALHPAAVLFLMLSAMLLIPNYPYYVIFFYTTLGIFFISLSGRENQDLFFTLLLPVRKAQAVHARIALAVLLELSQLLLAVPFAVLRGYLDMPGNLVGMDANLAFFGLAAAMLGLFNYVFFTRYYRRPEKVGAAFLQGTVALALFMLCAEVCVHTVPFFRDRLDTPDPAFLAEKLVVLAAGAVVYAVLTWAACRRSVRLFEPLDL